MIMSTAQTYAVVESGVIINMVVWDGGSEWSPPEGTTAVIVPAGTNTGIGATYAGGVFGAPPVANDAYL